MEQTAASPQRLTVRVEIVLLMPLSSKIKSDMINCIIRIKGMTVIAVFSLRTMQEIRTAIISEEKITSRKVRYKSKYIGKIRPDTGR